VFRIALALGLRQPPPRSNAMETLVHNVADPIMLLPPLQCCCPQTCFAARIAATINSGLSQKINRHVSCSSLLGRTPQQHPLSENRHPNSLDIAYLLQSLAKSASALNTSRFSAKPLFWLAAFIPPFADSYPCCQQGRQRVQGLAQVSSYFILYDFYPTS
jgi:hypothetical protein